MFKQRLLTAMALVPMVFIAIYYANIWVLGSVVVLIVMISGFEWLQLIPIQLLTSKLLFLLALPVFLGLAVYFPPAFFIVGLTAWALILPAVVFYPRSEPYWGYRPLVGGLCWLLLPLFAVTFAMLYQLEQGRDLVVYLLCLVWATDIGAYLAGKQWGKHKLIPDVSPGKTQEGALGGMAMAMLVTIVGCIYFNPYSVGIWFVISFVTILISMLGDLFMSMLKRRAKVKDTGGIFPGHGGMLDRLDSLIAASPILYCGLLYMNPGL